MDYYESEEFLELLADYERGRKHDERPYLDADDLMEIGQYYLGCHQFEEALDVADHSLRIHPKDIDILNVRIEANINLRNFKEARADMKKLSADDEYDLIYFKAQLALADGNHYEKAEKLFDQWLEKEMDEIMHGSAYDDSIGSSVDDDDDDDDDDDTDPSADDDDAEDDDSAGSMTEIDERRGYENYRLKVSFLHIIASYAELCKDDTGENVTKMLDWVGEYVKNCTELGADDVDIEIARLCHEQGAIGPEIWLYEIFLDTDPYLPGGWTYLASLQHMEGMFQEAADSVSYALAAKPDDPYSLMLYAQCLFRMERYREALKPFEKYLKLTNDESYLHYMGMCYMASGKRLQGRNMLSRAEKFFEKQRESDPEKYNDKYMSDMMGMISAAYMEGRVYDKALTYLDKALRLKPDDTALMQQRGNILLGMDEYMEAEFWFVKSLETTSLQFLALMSIGGIYMLHNRCEDALYYFQSALERTENPEHETALGYMAYVYYMLGKKRDYRKTLKLALEKCPETVEAFWKNYLEGIEPEDYYKLLSKLV